jgi:hypothetical protein
MVFRQQNRDSFHRLSILHNAHGFFKEKRGIYGDAVKVLQTRRQGLLDQMGRIDVAVKALGGIRTGGATTRRKPQFSKAGLARIAAAQRARWAKIKAAQKK